MTQAQYGPDGWPAGAQQQQQYGPPPQQQYAPQQQQYGPPPQAYPPPPVPPRVAGPPPPPDELMTGGYKAAQYPDQAYGTEVGGAIVAEPKTTQQIDFDSQKPKFYEDGNPAWQIVCPVQAFAPQQGDDGIRAFYLKGQMKQAAISAIQRAGGTRLEMGGQLFMRYIRDEPNQRGRGKPKKIYEGRYVLPSAGSAPAPGPAPAPAGPPPQAYAPPPQAPPQQQQQQQYGPPQQQYGPPPQAPPPQQQYGPPATGYMGAGDVAGVTPDPWGPSTQTIDQPPY